MENQMELPEGYHPPLKTGEEMRADLKEAKKKIVATDIETQMARYSARDQESWVRGYNTGYKAGRDGERKRNIELVNKTIKEIRQIRL